MTNRSHDAFFPLPLAGRGRGGGHEVKSSATTKHPRHPHPVRLRSLVELGGISEIVLATRLSARTMGGHGHALSDSSPPDIAVRRTASFGRLCRWSMLTQRARTPVEALCERSFGMDARVKPGHDEEKRKERKASEAKRRQTQGRVLPRSTGAAAPLSGEAHIYRRSTAVLAPRSLSSQGTQHQARLPATRWGHVLRIPLSGRYPPLPVPVQRRTSRPSRNAREMMPNAARERIAKPRAGTALARAAWACLPGRVRQGEIRKCM